MNLPYESAPQASWITARRAVWFAVIVAVLLGALVVVRLTAAVSAKNALTTKNSVPAVSVTEAGHSDVANTVSIIGNIDARYDTPIGVEGDGGRVAKIYVEAGDRVKRGQLLAQIDTSVLQPQVANLQAALDLARAEADLAAAEYKRAMAVGKSGALSAEETERRRSTSVTAAAKVKVAAAMLAEAEARLARAEVRAPADGILLTRSIEVGQTAAAGGGPLFRLAEGGEVELRGQVAEQDLPLLKVGQNVTVHLTGSAKFFPGQVRLLGAIIDPQTRLGMVRVSLKPDPNLRPGAFARAEVSVSDAQRIVLPQTAVLTDANGSYVFIVDGNNKVERRVVKVAGMAGNGVMVAEGLSDKDRVVTAAGAFLQEGELVNPVHRTAGST
jgi:HlyD family secretion protein